jgi:hypothetical protein
MEQAFKNYINQRIQGLNYWKNLDGIKAYPNLVQSAELSISNYNRALRILDTKRFDDSMIRQLMEYLYRAHV